MVRRADLDAYLDSLERVEGKRRSALQRGAARRRREPGRYDFLRE